MPKFQATVTVALKPEILDPAGEATTQVLQHMGYIVEKLRIGRHIDLTIEADDVQAAEDALHKMASDILANPIMETYSVQVLPS